MCTVDTNLQILQAECGCEQTRCGAGIVNAIQSESRTSGARRRKRLFLIGRGMLAQKAVSPRMNHSWAEGPALSNK